MEDSRRENKGKAFKVSTFWVRKTNIDETSLSYMYLLKFSVATTETVMYHF